jgi:hypothetical protein
MSAESKAKQNWIDLYKMFGKGSPEEIAAYKEYIKISQGEGRSKIRKLRKQTEIKGISEADTFTMVNPETNWSEKLNENKPMIQSALF